MSDVAARYLSIYSALSGPPEGEMRAWLPVLASARLAETATGETERLMALVDAV